MWTCKEMKASALESLQKSYGYCIFVTLMIHVIAVMINRFTIHVSFPDVSNFEELARVIEENYSAYLFTSIASLISNLAFSIFLFQVLSVGEYYFYINADRGMIDYKSLFYPFRAHHYMNIVKVKALRFFKVFLWSLLLIVPGVVKLYEYFFVDMILCDCPQIGARKALHLSAQITRGHKGHIFLLRLSFLGWMLLGTLLCGVGVIFVYPYIYETDVKLYYHLKSEAIMNGSVLPGDFLPDQDGGESRN